MSVSTLRRDPPALLVDYGEVISLAQPPGALEAMAAAAGAELGGFAERYWQYRPDYDRGGDPRSYWAAVSARPIDDPGVIGELRRLDLESWSLLNPETLEVLAEARGRGSSLSLLSNAPHDLAAALDDHPALVGFDHLLFSARLGVIKPERAVFEAAIGEIGRPPGEVIFIDDRPVNVEGARGAGLRAVHFTSAAQLRADLFGAG